MPHSTTLRVTLLVAFCTLLFGLLSMESLAANRPIMTCHRVYFFAVNLPQQPTSFVRGRIWEGGHYVGAKLVGARILVDKKWSVSGDAGGYWERKLRICSKKDIHSQVDFTPWGPCPGKCEADVAIFPSR